MSAENNVLTLKSVCPHDCPDTCGMLVRVDSGTGRLLSVRGDPEHPITRGYLCTKVNRYVERVYSPDRVLYPLRRVGPKGRAEFQRIGWDEALDLVAGKFAETRERHGAESILPYSYGGTMGVVNNASMDRRFFHKLGASLLERTICSAAGNAGYRYTVGAAMGADPETTPEAKLIIAWGVNLVSTNLHQVPLIQEARKKGATFVLVDVHHNRTADVADHFVQVYPGTDGALALGLMNIIIGDDLHDAEYVAKHTVGFEALRERVRQYPPERVATITGVPAERIRWLARLYATTKPSLIRLGNGFQHHTNGGMATRTVACLPALVGAWGQAGGGAFKGNSGYFALNQQALERPDLMPSPRPRTINMNRLGEALLEATPPVKMLYVYNSNPAGVAPAQARVLEGLRRDDLFTVVHEQLLTDTAAYADVVLPATTHMEHTDLYKSYWHLYLQFAAPVIAPLAEAKPNDEVFRLFAQRMGFAEPCFRDTAEDIIAQALETDNPFMAGIDLPRLMRERVVRLNLPDRPHIAYADGRFPTPSGKVEFYSEAMARDGYDPLPSYQAAGESLDGEEASGLRQQYPMMLVTPPAHEFLNTTFANLSGALDREIRPTVDIHPADAAARGIEEGNLVRIFNDRGESKVYAQVRESVLPGVAVGTGVWWPRHSPEGANLNQTTPDRLSDMGNGATFFSNLVQIQRCDG